MAKGDIVLVNGRPAEVVSEGSVIEVIVPAADRLTPEVCQRLGKVGAIGLAIDSEA